MSDALRWAEERAALLAANHALAVIELRARLDALTGGDPCATGTEAVGEMSDRDCPE